MFKRALRTLLILVLLAAVGGGVWYFRADLLPQSSTTATTEFTQIVTVERGNLAATISVVGELYAPENSLLAFDQLGGKTKLRTLEVTAGNRVEAGQVLATIDPTPYEQALTQAETTLQSAKTALADLQKPATALAIAQAGLAIAQADLAVQQAQSALDELLHPDIAALQSAVADAQLALTEAQATLAGQGSSTSDDQVAQLRETAGDAGTEYQRLAAESYTDDYYKDRLELARNAMLDPQDTLATMDIQGQIDLLSAQSGVRKAEQRLATAQEALQAGQAPIDELARSQAEVAVAQANVDLAQAKADRDTLAAGPDPAELTTAQSAVDDAKQAVADAEAELAATTLRAPFAGTVLQTNVVAGNNITADSTILTLANLTELQVVATVDETTIRQIVQGQPVEITFDAFPGQRFQGEVLAIPLQGELQGDVMVYQVPISLPDAQDLPLLVGMTANAAIEVGHAEDVLLVPTMVIQRGRGQPVVFVPGVSEPGATTPAAPVLVQVEVGLSDGIRTEVVSGLNEGDQVVVQMSAGTNNTNFRVGGGGILGGIPGAGRNSRGR